MGSSLAERPEHRQVLALLEIMDIDLLTECACYFGGGTAVSLRCAEPRVSRDVDFLCSSHEGYRLLRQRVFGRGARALFRQDIEPVRELRADRYGVRASIRAGASAIKLELVSEGRIELEGVRDPALPVMRLSDDDLVAEKLLANVDRGLDDASLGRDIIDLLLLDEALGGLPERAFEKARGAYGDAVDRAFDRMRARIRDDAAYRVHCFDALGIDAGPRGIVERRARG